MDQRERFKYLLKSVLGVDVDEIAARTLAQIAIQRAKQIPHITREWLKDKERKDWVTVTYKNRESR